MSQMDNNYEDVLRHAKVMQDSAKQMMGCFNKVISDFHKTATDEQQLEFAKKFEQSDILAKSEEVNNLIKKFSNGNI